MGVSGIRCGDPPCDSYCPGPVVEHRLRVMVSHVLLSLYSDACRQLGLIRDAGSCGYGVPLAAVVPHWGARLFCWVPQSFWMS